MIQAHGDQREAVLAKSTITCPSCRHRRQEAMPTDACLYFYECTGCGRLLRPKHGDCCVFCSYGDVPCPPMRSSGRNASCGPCK